MALIEVKNLSKVYDNEGVKTDALHDINLNVEKGEFLAIMGPSGSGKSTLLQILGLLDNHTHGTYHFADKNVKLYDENEIAKIRNQKMGFVFQAFNLLPHLTLIENVKMPLLYSDKPEHEWDKRAEDALISVGLGHRLTHQAFQLSGGEKQRVAIARALVNDPEVIFADEPTGNLDSKSGQAVIEIIEKLNSEMGHTIILITHETYTAEYAQRIVKLLDGQIESDHKVKNRKTSRDHFIK